MSWSELELELELETISGSQQRSDRSLGSDLGSGIDIEIYTKKIRAGTGSAVHNFQLELFIL